MSEGKGKRRGEVREKEVRGREQGNLMWMD